MKGILLDVLSRFIIIHVLTQQGEMTTPLPLLSGSQAGEWSPQSLDLRILHSAVTGRQFTNKNPHISGHKSVSWGRIKQKKRLESKGKPRESCFQQGIFDQLWEKGQEHHVGWGLEDSWQIWFVPIHSSWLLMIFSMLIQLFLPGVLPLITHCKPYPFLPTALLIFTVEPLYLQISLLPICLLAKIIHSPQINTHGIFVVVYRPTNAQSVVKFETPYVKEEMLCLLFQRLYCKQGSFMWSI